MQKGMKIASCLKNMSFSPSIRKQHKGPDWPVTENSSNTWKTSRATSSASWATAPEVAELGKGDGAPSSPQPCRLYDKPPPVPERSSRRVKFRLPLMENVTVEQSCLSCTETRQSSKPVRYREEIESYTMPPSVYGHWLALQDS